MPFEKGHTKVGGRKAGTVNKLTSDIQVALAELDCDPIVGMALIAKDKKNKIELRFKAYAQLAEYVYAKRRSIEIAPSKAHPTGAKLITYPDAVKMLMALEDEIKGKRRNDPILRATRGAGSCGNHPR